MATLGLIASEVLPLDIGCDNVLRLPSQWNYLRGIKTASTFVAPRPAVYIPSNPLDMLIFPAVHDELESITTDSRKIRRSLDAVGLPQHVLNQELVRFVAASLSLQWLSP